MNFLSSTDKFDFLHDDDLSLNNNQTYKVWVSVLTMDNIDIALDIMMDGLNDIENNINNIYQPVINNLNENIIGRYEPLLIKINENIAGRAIEYNKLYEDRSREDNAARKIQRAWTEFYLYL